MFRDWPAAWWVSDRVRHQRRGLGAPFARAMDMPASRSSEQLPQQQKKTRADKDNEWHLMSQIQQLNKVRRPHARKHGATA